MTWIAVTKDQLDDAEAMTVALVDALVNPREPSAETLAYLAKRDALYSDDVSDLSEDEAAAVNALYNDPDIEVGSEGIGGFYAGQAEATIRTLRKAGFRVVR